MGRTTLLMVGNETDEFARLKQILGLFHGP